MLERAGGGTLTAVKAATSRPKAETMVVACRPFARSESRIQRTGSGAAAPSENLNSSCVVCQTGGLGTQRSQLKECLFTFRRQNHGGIQAVVKDVGPNIGPVGVPEVILLLEHVTE